MTALVRTAADSLTAGGAFDGGAFDVGAFDGAGITEGVTRTIGSTHYALTRSASDTVASLTEAATRTIGSAPSALIRTADDSLAVGSALLLLEDGSGILLEDGSGVLLLEGSLIGSGITEGVARVGTFARAVPDNLPELSIGVIATRQVNGQALHLVRSVADSIPAITEQPTRPRDFPAPVVRIDFDNDGVFSAGDDVTASILTDTLTWTRGRSADRTTEATGSMSFSLLNTDGRFTDVLLPGMPVHCFATYGGVDYPRFFGYIERVAPNPADRTVAVTCYDVLRRLSQVNVVVPPTSILARCARDFRVEALGDYERGSLNLLSNPAFATDTAQWDKTGGILARITTDHPPVDGVTTCARLQSNGDTWVTKPYLVPMVFAGQTYRFSVYLKWVDGDTAVTLTFGNGTLPVQLTSSWVRYTFTGVVGATQNVAWGSSSLLSIVYTSGLIGWATFLMGAVSLTRGAEIYPYSEAGVGRYPNYCANGSFDAGVLTNWYDGWVNLCSNGNFETNTAGWSSAGDAYHSAANAFARSTAQHDLGSASARIISTAADSGVSYAIPGTFLAGHTYAVVVRCYTTYGGTYGVTAGVGSAGTSHWEVNPAGAANTWYDLAFDCSPGSDYGSLTLYVKSHWATTYDIYIDRVTVYHRPQTLAYSPPNYTNTGPGGGGTWATAATSTAHAKFGSKSLAVTTQAVAGSGQVYDFNLSGPVFIGGRPYTLGLWIYCAGSFPYKVGIGADNLNGTWDEASVTGTASAGVPTQVTVTWTPTADRFVTDDFQAVAYVYQTDTTARTFYVDGVRVAPGSVADAFEMPQWNLASGAEVDDGYTAAGTVQGSALSVLTTLNNATLSRHWIEPTMAYPWYQYCTSDRTTYAAKVSSETYDEGIKEMTSAEVDGSSIVNVISAGAYGDFSDESSVAAWGLHPGNPLTWPYYSTAALPAKIAAADFARHSDPRSLPQMTVENRFPSQLVRELDDLVTVYFARLAISGGEYLIQRAVTRLTDDGTVWATTYDLEGYPL